MSIVEFVKYFGFEPEKNETVIFDGKCWIIDGFFRGQVLLCACHPIAV
jgi:hypothetical protein